MYVYTYIYVIYNDNVHLYAFHNCYRKIYTPQNVDRTLLDALRRPNESDKIQLQRTHKLQ